MCPGVTKAGVYQLCDSSQPSISFTHLCRPSHQVQTTSVEHTQRLPLCHAILRHAIRSPQGSF